MLLPILFSLVHLFLLVFLLSPYPQFYSSNLMYLHFLHCNYRVKHLKKSASDIFHTVEQYRRTFLQPQFKLDHLVRIQRHVLIVHQDQEDEDFYWDQIFSCNTRGLSSLQSDICAWYQTRTNCIRCQKKGREFNRLFELRYYHNRYCLLTLLSQVLYKQASENGHHYKKLRWLSNLLQGKLRSN